MAEGFQPHSESLQRALRWISDRRRDDPAAKLAKLIDEAALQFDLTPMDADFLWRELTSPIPKP